MAGRNWLAVHPSNTEKIRVPNQEDGLLIEFGFWPPAVDARLRPRCPGVSVFQKEPQSPKTVDERVQRNQYDLAVCREAAKYGVRGWDGPPDRQAVLAEEVIDGRRHTVLADESLDLLYANGLLYTAGAQAIVFNVLTDEQKKTPEQPSASGSSNPPTTAPGATPPTNHQETPPSRQQASGNSAVRSTG